jgi:hypothetical protein
LDLLNDNFFNSISNYNVTTFHYSLNKGTTMTDNIKELANLPVTLLAVTETNVHLQTESGKGVMTLTSANLGGGSSGGAAAFQDILYTDDTNAQFIYKDTGTTVPIITAYLVPEGTVYTVGTNPRPYTVNDLRVTSVDLGVKADTVATTDTGTFSLIALFKRLLAKVTALISTQTIVLSVPPQVVAIGSTSTQSATFNATTSRIILNSTVDCWIKLGTNPTASATTGSFYQSAGIPSYITSVTGVTDKLAVIRTLGDGNLSIIELI